ncbi:uncharacterized protein FFNC_15342 [Fusarium fujikuroi]|nr:uncharacterized protein FFNC_15342 [Fusarium fujikuroi]
MAVSTERILGRLNLRLSNKQKMKKPVAETLQLAVASIRTLHQEISSRAGLVNSATAFESKANEVVKLIAAWTKHQTPIRLKDIVEGIHELWMIERLDELFDCIPNNLMDPNLRTSLQNIIGKVARYKEAARYLYRMAKKFPAVRRAKIVSVTLQQHMFAEVELNNYSPSLPSALNRIARKHNLSINYAQICPLLGLNKEQVERKFSDNVRRALRGAKVHAEVQLFYHIEMLRLAQPPRVVCSNKDACYLCDFFIAVTKKLHSPQCHGRLYPGWRLPASSIHDQTLEKFNHALEEKVRDSVRTLLKSQKKFRLPDPRESTIFEIARSVSTLAPSSTSPSAVEVATDDSSISSNGITSGNMDQSTHSLLNGCLQAAEELSVFHNDEISTIESNASNTTHDLSQVSLLSDKQADTRQKPEIKCSERITACVISKDVSCICIGPLRLYVEYSASHNKDIEHTRRELKFDVEWITHINDGPARQDVESSVIEIEKSAYTASLPLNTMSQLDVNYGGRILRIRLHP